MPSVITQILRLTDTADTTKSARWRSAEQVGYTLTGGRLVIRATETEDDAVPALLDVAATLSDSNTLATVVLTAAAITAATIPSTAVWEFVLTRSDGRKMSVVGGQAVWSRGVARP